MKEHSIFWGCMEKISEPKNFLTRVLSHGRISSTLSVVTWRNALYIFREYSCRAKNSEPKKFLTWEYSPMEGYLVLSTEETLCILKMFLHEEKLRTWSFLPYTRLPSLFLPANTAQMTWLSTYERLRFYGLPSTSMLSSWAKCRDKAVSEYMLTPFTYQSYLLHFHCRFQYYLTRKDDNQKLTNILTLLLDHGAKVIFCNNVKPIFGFFTSSNGKDRLSRPLETTLSIGRSITQTQPIKPIFFCKSCSEGNLILRKANLMSCSSFIIVSTLKVDGVDKSRKGWSALHCAAHRYYPHPHYLSSHHHHHQHVQKVICIITNINPLPQPTWANPVTMMCPLYLGVGWG